MHSEPTSHIAAIDLGSNTFHIIIVDKSSREVVFRERVFVFLAESGISEIGDGPFLRGLDTLRQFRGYLDQYDVQDCKICGTAALRSASNATDFVHQAEVIVRYPIQIIDGIAEANLIFKGIALSVAFDPDKSYVIMDIGGGSVEFITVENGELQQTYSFNIGLGELYAKYPHGFPIQEDQLYAHIKEHIQSTIAPVFAGYEKPFAALIGASGSFEVLEAMYQLMPTAYQYNSIDRSQFEEVASMVYSASQEDLKANPSIPDSRRKLIGLAFTLIDQALQASGAQRIYISPTAMKEGMIAELLVEGE